MIFFHVIVGYKYNICRWVRHRGETVKERKVNETYSDINILGFRSIYVVVSYYNTLSL